MKSLAVKLWLSVLLLLVACYAAYTGYDILRRKQEESRNRRPDLYLRPLRPLSDFQFTERSRRTVKFADLEGHVVAFNFFFANCPGTCRNLNDKMAALHKQFAADGVRFVSVTIDPSSDTPERLENYARAFGADEHWWFVTGPLEHVQDLGQSLKLTAVGRDSKGDLTHTDQIVILDRAGTIRGAYNHLEPKELKQAAEKIKELLAEKTPPPQPAAAASSSSPGPRARPVASPGATPAGSATASPATPVPGTTP